MALSSYLRPLLAGWWIIAIIIAIDIVVSGASYVRSARHAGYQGCTTLYVADVGAPGLISAPETALQAEGTLLAGETAANFFGDDIVDVAESQHVAAFVAAHLAGKGLPDTSEAAINGTISGSRRDRTVQLCATNPNAASAQAVAGGAALAMTKDRARFVGTGMAKRTFVDVISDPSVAKVSTRHLLTTFAERVVLGILVALALAYLWDALRGGSNAGPTRARLVS